MWFLAWLKRGHESNSFSELRRVSVTKFLGNLSYLFMEFLRKRCPDLHNLCHKSTNHNQQWLVPYLLSIIDAFFGTVLRGLEKWIVFWELHTEYTAPSNYPFGHICIFILYNLNISDFMGIFHSLCFKMPNYNASKQLILKHFSISAN